MGKVLDFDKFMSEKNQEYIDVTVFGKVYKVESRIPAIVPVMMARAENTSDGQVATKLVMKAADSMFGSEAIDEFCNQGMSAAELSSLVTKVFSIINGSESDDESEELSDEDSRTATKGGRARKK